MSDSFIVDDLGLRQIDHFISRQMNSIAIVQIIAPHKKIFIHGAHRFEDRAGQAQAGATDGLNLMSLIRIQI